MKPTALNACSISGSTTSCPRLPQRAKHFQIFHFCSDDVAAPYAGWKGAELSISELHMTDDGKREFEPRDPDGFWLWFGQKTSETPIEHV
jgi:hypothetical protein